jgi:hypothetical protein
MEVGNTASIAMCNTTKVVILGLDPRIQLQAALPSKIMLNGSHTDPAEVGIAASIATLRHCIALSWAAGPSARFSGEGLLRYAAEREG